MMKTQEKFFRFVIYDNEEKFSSKMAKYYANLGIL